MSGIIYGGIIAAVLLLITLLFDTHFFMADYQKHFLDTQTSLTQQIYDLKKENAELQSSMRKDLEKSKEKQEYLEKLLLEKANDSLGARTR